MLGQHVRQLKDGYVSGQVVRSSGGSSCARSGCGPAEGSLRIILFQVRLWAILIKDHSASG